MDKKSENIENFEELKLKTEITRLKRENKAALTTIDKLIIENKQKNDEILHLTSLLGASVPVLLEHKQPQKVIQFELPAEEEIAEVQLVKLREISRKRAFTLEETRQYDLLVKNKRLTQIPTTDLDQADFKNLKEADLLQIAGKFDGKKSPNS